MKRTMPSSRSLKIARHRLVHDFIMETVGRRIAGRGFVLKPYYVIREGLFDGRSGEFALGSPGYQISFLTLEDVKDLDLIDGRGITADRMLNQLRTGHKCLGLKIDREVAAFTWCRFDLFDYPPMKGFALKENEAYLYDMYVLKAYRGLNIAPLLRYACYQELSRIGRTVLFSASDVSNRPAVRFKKKLDARIVALRLYIRIGKNLRLTMKLRSYGM